MTAKLKIQKSLLNNYYEKASSESITKQVTKPIKPIIYIADNLSVSYLEDEPLKYLHDSIFDAITVITYSSELEQSLTLLSHYNKIDLYIAVEDNYIDTYKAVEEDQRISFQLEKLGKEFNIYRVTNTHIKAYFLYNTNNPYVKRVITGSANLSRRAWEHSQMEMFIVVDNTDIYEQLLNKLYNDILSKAEKVISNEEIEKKFEKENINTKVINVVVQGASTEEIQQIKEEAVKEAEETLKEKVNEMVMEAYVRIAKKDKKVIHQAITNLANEIKNAEQQKKEAEKRIDFYKTMDKLVKEANPNKMKDFIKNAVKNSIGKVDKKDMTMEVYMQTNFPYIFDSEKRLFKHRVLGLDIAYDKDELKKDIEILNNFIDVYCSPDGEYSKERYHTISFVLLYNFASYYSSFVRDILKQDDNSFFEIAPIFCLLVGKPNCGKTLLLTLLSRLNGIPMENYNEVVQQRNRGEVLYHYFATESVSPYLLDEVYPTDFADDKTFARAIKELSNNPFIRGTFTPHGHVFLTANADNLQSIEQITRRTFFIYFENSITNEIDFKQRIKSTGFNRLSDTLVKSYIFWLNENINTVEDFIRSFETKYSSKDVLLLAYNFLQQIGINITFSFPDEFGKYSYISKKKWADMYRYHSEIFMKLDDGKLKVDRKPLPKYLAPHSSFHIEHAQTDDFFVFDERAFLNYIGLLEDTTQKKTKERTSASEVNSKKISLLERLKRIFS